VSYKNAWLHFRRPLLTPGVILVTVIMDGCAFLGFKISGTIHSHYKVSKDIFKYNSDCVWLKEESHTPRKA